MTVNNFLNIGVIYISGVEIKCQTSQIMAYRTLINDYEFFGSIFLKWVLGDSKTRLRVIMNGFVVELIYHSF